jgi:isocitrate dehydrogenase kinase/phosphatase
VSLPLDIAHRILAGFDKHYRLFRATSAGARGRFERGDWAAVREASVERIKMYDQRVVEAVAEITDRFPEAERREALWQEIKLAYIGALYEHRQPECAETFYNSVACRVLHRRYYRNEYIFRRPAISTEHLGGDEPVYRCYYPAVTGMRAALRAIATSFDLDTPFANLERDLGYLERAIGERFPGPHEVHPNFQVQVLASLFFRNKAAYIVARAQNGPAEIPIVVPILKDARGELYLDALLTKRENVGRVFSLARAYFMVDMEVPSAYVAFLQSLLPSKPKAELYTLLGLQKQGKTLFFRDLIDHLKHSTDRFVVAPGTKGLVMVVFTLPSFPYVFKVIRDWFPPPKQVSRKKVLESYLVVKYHDRVGRMADTLEYSNVAFPLDRFEPALVEELLALAPSCVEIEGNQLVVRHLYIERRMVPLDLFLRTADAASTRDAVREYGAAVKELAGANIFPGDLLPKNFGVTRYGRVVFYDYDEICPLTDVCFREIPPPRSLEDEMAAEPFYAVGPNDVFPEELVTFLFPEGRARAAFLELHGELGLAGHWTSVQERIRAGEQADVFPYPESLRFNSRRP